MKKKLVWQSVYAYYFVDTQSQGSALKFQVSG